MSNTEQEINGIVVDLNRVTRRYIHGWFKRLEQAQDGEGEKLTAELAEKIVVKWPFGEVSTDVYMNLGAFDGEAADEALETALAVYIKKKSERASTSPLGTTQS